MCVYRFLRHSVTLPQKVSAGAGPEGVTPVTSSVTRVTLLRRNDLGLTRWAYAPTVPP